jgi:tRNA/rRNA methyltransferase
MAGTDRTKPIAAGVGPAIVLVEPQLGENIGMAARAMLNCGITELRLVRPRDGWPSEAAENAASGADVVIAGTKLYDSTADAVADLSLVFASTARDRDMTKRFVTPRQAAAEIRAFEAGGGKTGVLFGKEAKGLKNDDLALADACILAPVNPAFRSLNLAQAVFVVGYEWFMAASEAPASELRMPKETRPADKAELFGLFEHLERELDASGFLHVKEKQPVMVRNLRNMFQRMGLTEQEVRTLRGVITSLVSGFGRGNKKP